MRAHTTNARVQGEACGALLALSLAIDAAAHISSQASVSLSANTAKRNRGLAASAPAAHLLQVGPQTFKVVAGPEPAPTTTTITRPSASTTSSSAPAPTFTNNPQAIAEAGGIDAVTEAMRMHPGEMIVQRNGCLALVNLAVTSVNRNMIGAADGVARVLVAMKMHQTPEVQAAGCRALMNLATDNDQNSKAIAEAGVIPARVLARVLKLCSLFGPWRTISRDKTSLSRHPANLPHHLNRHNITHTPVIDAEIKERVLRAHGKLIHMAIWACPDLAHGVSVLGRYVHKIPTGWYSTVFRIPTGAPTRTATAALAPTSSSWTVQPVHGRSNSAALRS